MKLLNALLDRHQPVSVSLSGYPVGYLQAPLEWDTGERVLDQHLLYLVMQGGFDLTAGGQQVALVAAGDLVLISPGTPFRATWTTGPRPAFWRLRLSLPVPWRGPLVSHGCHDCEALIAQLVAETTQSTAFHTECRRGLLLALFARLARHTQVAATSNQLSPSQRTRLERFADEHDDATPRDLARQLDLTLDYLTRLFTRTYGRPPRRWLLERRMQHAAVQVAESDLSIERIATDLGYADARLFGRQFRAVLGQPPGRFRSSVRSTS